MQIEFSADEKVLKENLAMKHRQHVFLIFKEAVNNSVKYSGGKKLSVFLNKENHYIKLSVADDGIGFDPAKTTSSNGLKNMRDRAMALKGTLSIQSSPGKGAKVELICPTT
jgi:signal transduction histidine kinase